MKSFSLTLLMTEKCNLRCNYCYEEFSYASPTVETMARIRGLFSKLASSYDDIHVSFFGGEPTLAMKKIRDLIQHGSGLRSKFTYSITSNGTLLNRDLLQMLVDGGLVQAQITLDGLQATHDAARKSRKGAGTFDKIYANLLSYREVSGDVQIIIRVNASPGNANDIASLSVKLVSDFGHDPRFRTYLRAVGKWGGSGDNELKVLNKLDFSELDKNFAAVVPDRMMWKPADQGICYAAMPNHLLVYPDGRLGKCTVGIHDDVNSIGHIEASGELRVDPEKLSYWSRGFASGKKSELACPYWAS